jgi:hypothetical protein
MVTAGLAKLVELVNQYAAPMYAPPAAGAGQGEDEQDQPGGGDDLAEPQVAGGPVFAGEVDGGQGEHEVGQDRPGDGPDGLRGRTSGEVPAGEPGAGTPVEEPVRGRDDRVEVRPGHRPEDQDQRAERERGRDRVFQQLQTDVVRRQPGGHDPGADHGGDQQGGAAELGEETPPRRVVGHPRHRAGA